MLVIDTMATSGVCWNRERNHGMLDARLDGVSGGPAWDETCTLVYFISGLPRFSLLIDGLVDDTPRS